MKKNKKKKEKIPLNKLSKRTLIICSSILGFLLLSIIIGIFSKEYATFFWYYIRNPIYGLGFKLFEFNPKIGTKFPLVLVGVITILVIIDLYVENRKKYSLEKRLNMLIFVTQLNL